MSRAQAFMVFFTVVILLYAVLNTYLFLRVREVLPSHWKLWGTILFWILASSYIIGRVVERFFPSHISTGLIWIGSYWLGVMAYGIVLLLILDCVRFVLYLFPFIPRPPIKKEIVALVVCGILVLAIGASRINALNPVVRSLSISTEKILNGNKCTIVALSDIHLGTMVCNSQFERIVERVNALQPDVVVLVGDILDEDVEPVLRNNFGETLQKLRARYGVYGITGNHEYIGGVENAVQYLEKQGVRMLRDTAVVLENGVVLVGREDVTSLRFGGRRRKPLHEIMKSIQQNGPTIVLDHQPVALSEVVSAGVDLQISGHTHHGQLFPFNFIASAVYEVSWGYIQKEKTHIYVSCGVGTWGPPLRSGNRPEIVHITLTHQ